MAIQHPVEADLLLVPDSGITAAIGFARQSKFYGEVLIKTDMLVVLLSSQTKNQEESINIKLNTLKKRSKVKEL